MPCTLEGFQYNAHWLQCFISFCGGCIVEAILRLKIHDNQEEGSVAHSSPYPDRPGEPDCIYYLRTGLCGYGSNCRFNHPAYSEQVIFLSSALICWCYLLLLEIIWHPQDVLRVPSIEVNSQKELDNLTVGYILSQISLCLWLSILCGVYITFWCTVWSSMWKDVWFSDFAYAKMHVSTFRRLFDNVSCFTFVKCHQYPFSKISHKSYSCYHSGVIQLAL